MTIRLATISDVDAIARLHTASWLDAFRQFAPEIAEVRRDQLAARLKTWQAILTAKQTVVYVMTDETGNITGFAEGGAVREELDVPYDGELVRLYVAPDCKNKGIGKQLIYRIATHLQSEGHQSLVVVAWSINHPARAVYEHMGATFVKEIVQQNRGFDTSQSVYVWKDIQTMIEATQ